MNAPTYKAKIKSILKDSAIARNVYRKKTGKLDTKSLKAYRTTGKCFKKIAEIGKKDYAITFLLDLSGSMSNACGQKERIEVLTESLEPTIRPIMDMGANVEILGFNTTITPFLLFGQKAKKNLFQKIARIGASHVGARAIIYYKRVKLPDGRTAKLVLPCEPKNGSYSGTEMAGGYNFDGLATFQAVKRLSKQKEKNKVLFVFSDGEPTDSSYWAHWSDPTRTASDYSIERSVKIAKMNGIEILSIGIADSSVFDYYPKQNTRVIKNQEEMLNAMYSLLLKTIKR